MSKVFYHGFSIYSYKQSGKWYYKFFTDDDKEHVYESLKECMFAIDNHVVNGKFINRC